MFVSGSEGNQLDCWVQVWLKDLLRSYWAIKLQAWGEKIRSVSTFKVEFVCTHLHLLYSCWHWKHFNGMSGSSTSKWKLFYILGVCFEMRSSEKFVSTKSKRISLSETWSTRKSALVCLKMKRDKIVTGWMLHSTFSMNKLETLKMWMKCSVKLPILFSHKKWFYRPLFSYIHARNINENSFPSGSFQDILDFHDANNFNSRYAKSNDWRKHESLRFKSKQLDRQIVALYKKISKHFF